MLFCKILILLPILFVVFKIEVGLAEVEVAVVGVAEAGVTEVEVA
jgi:hypothetical protein